MYSEDVFSYLKTQAELGARFIDWASEADTDESDPSSSLAQLSELLTDQRSAGDTLLLQCMQASLSAARQLVRDGLYKKALAIVLRVLEVDSDHNEAVKMQRQIVGRIIQEMLEQHTAMGVDLAQSFMRDTKLQLEQEHREPFTELIAREKGFLDYLARVRKEVRAHPESGIGTIRESITYPLNSPLLLTEASHLNEFVEGLREYFRSLQQALTCMRARSLGPDQYLEYEMTAMLDQLSLESEDEEWMGEQKDAFIARRQDIDENLLDEIEARYSIDNDDVDLDEDVLGLIEDYDELAADELAYVRTQIAEFTRARSQMMALRDQIYQASLDLGCNVETIIQFVHDADPVLEPHNDRIIRAYLSTRESRAYELQEVRDSLETLFMKLDDTTEETEEIIRSLGDVDEGEQQVLDTLLDQLKDRQSFLAEVRNRVHQVVTSKTDIRVLCERLGGEYKLTPGEAKGLFAYATTRLAREVRLDDWRKRLAEVVVSFVLPETEVTSQADDIIDEATQELSVDEIQKLETYRQALEEQRVSRLPGLKVLIDERWVGASKNRTPDIRKIIKKSGASEEMQKSATYYLEVVLKSRKS